MKNTSDKLQQPQSIPPDTRNSTGIARLSSIFRDPAESPSANILEDRRGYFDLTVREDVDDIKRRQSPTQTPCIGNDRQDDQDKEWPQSRNAVSTPGSEAWNASEPCHSNVTTANEAPTSRKEKILDFLHRRLEAHVVRRILKCTLAYFISTLFSVIHPVADALGQAPYITSSGTLFNHPGRTVGSMFDATLTASLGGALSIVYGIAGLAASSAYNTAHPDKLYVGAIINCLFLVVGVFACQMIRQVYTNFFCFAVIFMVVELFAMTRETYQTDVSLKLPIEFGVPFLLGTYISLLVNLFVWPETAVDGLGRALKGTLTSSKEMLNLITQQFFLDPQTVMLPADKIDKTAADMRAGMMKVKTAYKEAKYEISYTYVRPKELIHVRDGLDRVTRHLSILGGSLKSERALVAKRDNDDEDNQQYDPEDNTGLRDAAHAAAKDFVETGKYRPQPQGQRSRPVSRRVSMEDIAEQNQRTFTSMRSMRNSPSSQPVSRKTSTDEDRMEQNQNTITSLRSLFSRKLAIPKPKPPQRGNKRIEHGDRELLILCLDSLRDPLMQLSMECAKVLDCICCDIMHIMDVDEDDQQSRKSWISYLCHVLQITKKAHRPERDRQSCHCASRIREAIVEFDKAQEERMTLLYRLNVQKMGGRGLDIAIREELFLVFFFIFSLREMATELETMAISMDQLQDILSNSKRRKRIYLPPFFSQRWWYKWAHSSNHQAVRDKGGYTYGALHPYIPEERRANAATEYELTRIQTSATTRQRSNSLTITKLSTQNSIYTPTLRRNASKSSEAPEPGDIEDQKLPKPPLILRFRYRLWEILQQFKSYEIRFALKTAIAVGILTVPAYIPESHTWFNDARGQWGALTIITIMNPTSGGTLQAGLWRLVGTVVGGFWGWAALEANGSSPYVLCAFAVIIALPTFYIHFATSYNKVGIITLVSYMIIALNRYAKPVANESTAATVWKRTGTLVVGIIFAAVLNWMLWPFVARDAVRKSISGVLDDLGDYFTYLMGTFLYHDKGIPPTEDDIKESRKIEKKIQKTINACSVLLELTDHEPRLKGPFPKEFYKEMIVSLGNLLDHILSIRLALLKMPPMVKDELMQHDQNIYRRDLVASLLLHFHTLSTSLKSKSPLPIYMPSARVARIRLLRHRLEERTTSHLLKYHNMAWFSMASSTEEVIEELEHFTDLTRFVVGENKFAERVKGFNPLW
ncbi:hypothetical protein DFQ28_011056 [Apophysomyces sp. BC1034]|nr:hypothetical protein DFQ30_010657 [Apophysomyces sp. BC1015]KAG0181301.1 hypothetical protein DFQ29_008744 [Apophysomyces sp. BC1021]KAG0191745.1 hypothetical protein DFQ28_011056 [Apophysomyces sp. BC1034]